MNQRDVRFDIMRGVGIMLMMLGHIPIEGGACKLIYSFHMPMFFLLSGLYAKKPESRAGGGCSLVVKLSRRLLLPFVSTIGSIVVLQILICITQDKSIHVGHVMGPLWFLPALWWARMCLGVINHTSSRYSLWVAIGIGLLAYIIGMLMPGDKLFVFRGLCAVPFLAIGQWVKNNHLPLWLITTAIAAWIAALCMSYLDMNRFIYGCWPLDIVGACGGTYVLYKVVDWIQNAGWMKRVMKPVEWIGQFSLATMCMHGLEWKALLPIEKMFCDGTTLLALRFVVTIVLTLIVVYMPVLRKIYG